MPRKIKKIATDGIRRKTDADEILTEPAEEAAYIPAPQEPAMEAVADIRNEPEEEQIPEGAHDESGVLERFMRKKYSSLPDHGGEIPEPAENKEDKEDDIPLQTGQHEKTLSSPEGEILISEPARDEKRPSSSLFGGKEILHKASSGLSAVGNLWSKKTAGPGASAEPDDTSTAGRKILSVRGGIVSGLIFVAVIFILLSTSFARVSISIRPHTEQITIKGVSAVLDASVSRLEAEKKVIPAERLEFTRNVSREFEATGKELVAEKARGKVRIYNRYSSSSQGLVANTRFLTDSGVLYRLVSAVTVPGAAISDGAIVPKFVDAELVADITGTEANLQGEVRLFIPGFKGSPKYDGFYGIAESGFSGGFRGDAKVVSKSDLENAEKSVTKEVFDALKEEMARKAPPDFKFAETLSEIEIVNVTSPRLNSRADKFLVEATARGRAMVFRESDVHDMLKSLIIKDDKTQAFMRDSLKLEYRMQSGDFAGGKANILVDGTAGVRSVIDVEALKPGVIGMKEGSIGEILKARSDISGFDVSVFPPWRSASPKDPAKVRVMVEDL